MFLRRYRTYEDAGIQYYTDAKKAIMAARRDKGNLKKMHKFEANFLESLRASHQVEEGAGKKKRKRKAGSGPEQDAKNKRLSDLQELLNEDDEDENIDDYFGSDEESGEEMETPPAEGDAAATEWMHFPHFLYPWHSINSTLEWQIILCCTLSKPKGNNMVRY